MDIANMIIVILGAIILLSLLSACCRGLQKAYKAQMSNEEIARRRQAFYIPQTARSLQTVSDERAVRVATLARDNDSFAYEIYEIRVPRRNVNTNSQMNVHIGGAGAGAGAGTGNETGRRPVAHGHGHGHGQGRRVRRSEVPPELLTPPPPFSTALQVSLPIPKAFHQTAEFEEPPPSYDDYLEQSFKNTELHQDNKLRY